MKNSFSLKIGWRKKWLRNGIFGQKWKKEMERKIDILGKEISKILKIFIKIKPTKINYFSKIIFSI